MFDPEEQYLVSMFLRLDPIKKIYSRSVRSMLEFLGDMGGLIQIVFLFFAGVVGFVIDRNFKAEIISDTYKVQKYNRDQSEFY